MAMSGQCHAQSGFAVMEDAPSTFMAADDTIPSARVKLATQMLLCISRQTVELMGDKQYEGNEHILCLHSNIIKVKT